jgi:hypothetical protein
MFAHMQLHVEGLCHGNLSEDEAVNISKIFLNTLSAPTLPEEARHSERVMCIPNGANFVRSVRVKNDLEENSVVEVGYVLVLIYKVLHNSFLLHFLFIYFEVFHYIG